jgi:hypothetical protein
MPLPYGYQLNGTDGICPSRAETAAAPGEEGCQVSVQEGGKPQRPFASKSEARRPQATKLGAAPLGEVREAVPGVVSPAQAPRLFPPFGLPPPPTVGRVGGHLKDFAPFWKDVLDCCPFILEAVTDFHPQFTSPPLPLPGGSSSSPPLRGRTTTSSTRRWRPF